MIKTLIGSVLQNGWVSTLIEDDSTSSQSIAPQKTQNYRLVVKGDRWQCIRCGSCCNADFEEQWLDFISMNHNPKGLNGKCLNLRFENNLYTCSIHSARPNACRAFPFTLKRQDDGGYRLVIHAGCRGYGKGRIIDTRNMILQCLRYSNEEFYRDMQLDFTSFDTNGSVVIVR